MGELASVGGRRSRLSWRHSYLTPSIINRKYIYKIINMIHKSTTRQLAFLTTPGDCTECGPTTTRDLICSTTCGFNPNPCANCSTDSNPPLRLTNLDGFFCQNRANPWQRCNVLLPALFTSTPGESACLSDMVGGTGRCGFARDAGCCGMGVVCIGCYARCVFVGLGWPPIRLLSLIAYKSGIQMKP